MITEWRAKEVMAAISGRVVQNMERACLFAMHQAQAKAPVRTGKLRRSFGYEVSARGNVIEGRVGVFRSAFYGYFHEVGTSKMPARPFLRPAVFGNAATIVKIIQGER
jgi:HK97 gp10 family phage protein